MFGGLVQDRNPEVQKTQFSAKKKKKELEAS